MGKEIELYRGRNEIELPKIASVTVPIGLCTALLSADIAWAGALAGVIAAVAALTIWLTDRPAMTSVIPDEHRSDDYTTAQKVVYFGPLLLSPIVIAQELLGLAGSTPWLIDLPTYVSAPLSGLFTGVAFTLATRGALSRNRNIGRRRARRILQRPSLEGITASNLELAREHGSILAALAAVGAVDDIWVTNNRLSKVLGVELETYSEALEALGRAGIIKLRRIGLDRPLPKWNITLTSTGVRILAELPRR